MGWKLWKCERGKMAMWVPDGGPCSATFRDAAGAEKTVEVKSLTVKLRGGRRVHLFMVRDGEERRVLLRDGRRWLYGVNSRYFIRALVRGENFADEVTVTQPILNKIPRKFVWKGTAYPDVAAWNRARNGAIPDADPPAPDPAAPAAAADTLPPQSGDGEVAGG